MLDATASPLPVANRREAKRDEIDDIVSPASPTNAGKQATTPATAPPPRRDKRDEKRADNLPAARDEERGDDAQ